MSIAKIKACSQTKDPNGSVDFVPHRNLCRAAGRAVDAQSAQLE